MMSNYMSKDSTALLFIAAESVLCLIKIKLQGRHELTLSASPIRY